MRAGGLLREVHLCFYTPTAPLPDKALDQTLHNLYTQACMAVRDYVGLPTAFSLLHSLASSRSHGSYTRLCGLAT